MKVLLLVFLSLAIISCGSSNNGDNPQQNGNRRFETSDPQFDTYKNDFQSGAASFSVVVDLSEIPINFGNLDDIENRTSSLKKAHFACKKKEKQKFLISFLHKHFSKVSIKNAHFAYWKKAGETQTVGVCIEYSNGLKEVLLRESSWQTLNNVSREILVFHELGHCEDGLDRDHKDQSYRGYDVSVMNSLLIDPTDYIRYYNEYLEELYTFDDQALRQAIDNDSIL